jgi:hypothetical protein
MFLQYLSLLILVYGFRKTSAQSMQYVAGTGSSGYNGDGSAALSTYFYGLKGVWGDTQGNLYLADNNNNRIRKIDTNNIVSTPVSGQGYVPWGVGGYGDFLYFVDVCSAYQYQISTGSYTRIAGIPGTNGQNGDGIPAVSSYLYDPHGITVSPTGTIYIADTGNNMIRVISGGIISRFVGTGSAGFGGDGNPAINANLYSPYGVWLNTLGDLYIADYNNQKIRKVSGGIITTVAGMGGSGIGDGVPAYSATIYSPADVKGDLLGNIYISEVSTYYRVRVVNTAGIISTVYSSSLNQLPYGLWVDTYGSVYFTQYYYLQKFSNIQIPSLAPTFAPTMNPSEIPTRTPTFTPSFTPTVIPTFVPTVSPTYIPTAAPTFPPTFSPTYIPSVSPTRIPTAIPTTTPTAIPSCVPTFIPTFFPTFSPTFIPSVTPTFIPTVVPTFTPTYVPTVLPTGQPSSDPSAQPSRRPTAQPTCQPTGRPSTQPSSRPTSQPTRIPTRQPTNQPTSRPSIQPTSKPSVQPTGKPSSQPSSQPSSKPTTQPTSRPTRQPTSRPSTQPSSKPSGQPTSQPTSRPSTQPSSQPSFKPTRQPTSQPTCQPTRQPTSRPSVQPSSTPSTQPTSVPTRQPSSQPSTQPTTQPSSKPTRQPSGVPSSKPTTQPSSFPSAQPTSVPSSLPSSCPTSQPSSQPTSNPSGFPSSQPTMLPSSQPTAIPTCQPTGFPSSQPSAIPSSQPSSAPSTQPSSCPSGQPSGIPSSQPTSQPSGFPSTQPSSVPSSQPTSIPSTQPTAVPSGFPTGQPSSVPSSQPSAVPTVQPSSLPTSLPTSQPSSVPSSQPTAVPTAQPSAMPTSIPTSQPSSIPSSQPTGIPFSQPTSLPSSHPTGQPSSIPTSQPTSLPTSIPTGQPSAIPSSVPSAQPSSSPTAVPSTQPSSIPTSEPSSEPSGSPTGRPTSVPSSQPSGKPTGAPSSVPSSVPSGSPSSKPTTVPRAHPTVIPSGSPTCQPTDSPTRRPTSHPTRQPSSQPSTQPIARPTGQPTTHPSINANPLHPTRAPVTAAPTLSLASLWNLKVTNSRASLSGNDSSAVVNRETFVQRNNWLDPAFNPKSNCQGWNSYISSQLYPALLNDLLPASLTAAFVNSPKENLINTTVQCSDRTASASIVAALVSTYQNTSVSVGSRQLTCSGNNWKIKRCSADALSVCINCQDPCSAAVTKFIYSPCRDSAQTLPTSFSLLSVSLIESPLAPKIISKEIVANKTSVTMNVRLSSDGLLYYGVFGSSSVPTISTILIQNRVATVVNNRSTVVIQGLQPATNYTIYFVTKSPQGIQLSSQQMLTTKTVVTTLCCRPLQFRIASQTIIAGETYFSGLTVKSASSLLSSALSVRPMLYQVKSSVMVPYVKQGLFFPSSTVLQGSVNSVPFTLSNLTVGDYALSLVIEGTEASLYSLVPAGVTVANQAVLLKLSVQSKFEPLPAPLITSALFSDDGSSIIFNFDRTTNLGGLTALFPCKELFNFSCSVQSKCQWIDSKTVYAYLNGGDSCAKPHDRVYFRPSVSIKAACGESGCFDVSVWPSSAALSLEVLPPLNPVVSSVSVSMPSLIGQCTPLQMDLSSSTGNGGRSWKSVDISVASSSTDVAALQTYLKSSHFDPSLPVIIPSDYLQPGSSYNFIITLCNFLGQCTPKSQKGAVGANVIPSIRVAGPNLRNIGVHESLSLSAFATLSRCNEDSAKQTFYNFEFKWSIYQGTTPLTLLSTAKDPSKFILPAYSLQLNSGYQVQVTATYQGSSSSVSTQVNVISGELIPVIQGGNDQVVRAGAVLSLDGSKSSDQNKKGVIGFSAGLSYSWSCLQISPTLTETCLNVFGSSSLPSTDSIQLTAVLSAVGYVAQITMTISDASTSRSVSTVVTVTVLPPVSASIALQSTAALNIINPGQSLQITASVTLPNISYFNATWSSSTHGFDLSSAALTPLNSGFIPKSGATVLPVYLKLSTAGLQGGLTYSFSLLCSLPAPGSATTASIVVKVNSAPRPGRFLVNPSEGVEFSDFFTFSCSQWQDENLPLQYRFAVLSATGSRVSLVSLSETSFKALQLTAGAKSNGYSVACLADIVDSLGANSTGTASVIVKEKQQGASAATAQLQNYFNQSANVFVSDDVNAIKQAAGMASYLINKVNCSLALNCGALNRQACSRIAQTCGPCLSENYIGVKGDSNEKCYKSASDVPVSNGDVLKACGGCSGHGTCQYKSLANNQVTPSCFENDFGCVPFCFCDIGYTTSPNCDRSDEQAAVKMIYRENLLTGIQSLMIAEDVSDGSISDWINNLSEATQITGELSSSSVQKAIEIADSITAIAQQSGSSSSSLLAILDSLDMICSAQIANDNGNRRRRLAGNTQSDSSSASLLALKSSVEKYGTFLASSLVPGQQPLTQLKSNIRLHVSAIKPSESLQDSSKICDSTTLVLLPQSTTEKILGIQPNFMIVPTCKRTSTSSDNLQIAVSSLSNEMYQNSYHSDPLSLSLSSFPCVDTTNCKVKIVMKRDSASSSLNASMIYAENHRMFNTSCGLNDYSVHYFDCPNGHRYNVTCRGKEEIIVGRCPRISEIPSCNSLSGSNNIVQNSCQMLSYTKQNITCLCSLLTITSRRLLINNSSNIPDKDIHVNYVAMLEAVTGNFEATVVSASSLNANMIEKGWQAMVTIATLFGAILVAMGFSLYADKQNQRIEISENQTKSKALSLAAKLQPSISFKMRAPPSMERKERARTDANNQVLQLAEESLPQILGSKSFVAKMKVELKRHHRWFGVVYHYSNKLSRLLRVVSLANNIIIMLFVQSLTYDLTNGNDGTCETLKTETACLEPRSAYSTGQSKCYWEPTAVEDQGKCGYIQPDNSVEVILFVAIFSALITTPFALLADRVIVHVLAAPTLSAKSSVKQLKVMDVKALEGASSIVPRTDLKLKMKESKQKEELEKRSLTLAVKKFESLTAELKKYKELLTDPKERKEFEGEKNCFRINRKS